MNASRTKSGKIAAAKAVTKRCFNFISSQKLAKLKEQKVKKKTQSKVNWGVTAFNQWRKARIDNGNCDSCSINTDLGDVNSLTKGNLIGALCYFVPEVTKKSGEPYPGPTLYQLLIAIQKYLKLKKIDWNIVYGPEFNEVRTVLDNVMQERTAENVGVGDKKQAKIITYEIEEDLWERGFLGTYTPEKLRTTTYYIIGINLYLRAVGEHYALRRWMPNQESQITFHTDKTSGLRYFYYQEDAVTKTHDGGLADMRNERKKVKVYQNLSNPDRDPVAILDKYLGLCPAYYKKPNLYLQVLNKPNPACWYAREVMGVGAIGKIIGKMMEAAGYEGFYSGHSLRRSGGSRLFQAGVQRKLVKECTSHCWDAVDKYQITSDKQKQVLCDIIAGNANVPHTQSENSIKTVQGLAVTDTHVPTKDKAIPKIIDNPKCDCSNSDMSGLLERLVDSIKKKGGGKIKIEIEIAQ